ncbi:MAG: sporulation integral membrane protein YtvI [Desulfitobacteriaceae bacterium]
MNSVTKNFSVRGLKFIAFWVVIGILIFLVGKFLYLFLPFIIAFILTATINPLKKFLVRRLHFPLALGVLVAMLIEIGGLGVVITLLILRLTREVHDIYLHWPHYSRVLEHVFSTWLNTIETVYLKLPTNYVDTINIYNTVNKMLNSVPGLLTKGFFAAAVVPEWIIIIVISLVATFFMSKNSQRYISDFVHVFPVEWQDSLRELGRDFTRAFGGFVRAEFIVFLITLFMSIFSLLLIRSRYAIILGTITGIFGILPVLGVGLVLVPWAIIAFFLGHTWFAVQLLLITSAVTIMRHIIEPKILGDNVGLDPLFVLISMYIGLAATGLAGLILGPFILIAYRSLQKAGVFRSL